MAVAFGADVKDINPGADPSFSGPSVSGSNTAGFVVAALQTGPTSIDIDTGGVTWDSSAMTFVKETVAAGTFRTRMLLYRLVAVSSGVTTIAVDWTGSVVDWVYAFYATGVDQSTPERATPLTEHVTTSTTHGDLSPTSATDDLVFSIIAPDGGSGHAVAGSQTLRESDTTVASMKLYAASAPGASGTVQMDWTADAVRPYDHVAWSIRAAVGGAPTLKNLALLGVGT